ncbi:MAG: hypothetical protein ACKOEC_12490 [Acidimicrobiia bacterium]
MQITTRALGVASRWFDEATCHRIFEPLIADWQREWQDASGRRRWSVSIRGLMAFVSAMLFASPAILRQPVPAAVSNRIVTRIARFTLIATVVQTLPFGKDFGFLEPSLLFLLPSSLVVMFPFAMIAAVDAIRCDHDLPAHTARAAMAKLAIASVVFMLVFSGVVTPAANQAFRAANHAQSLRARGLDESRVSRIMSTGDAPRRGLRELSTFELLTDHGFADGTRYLPETINRELHNRASLTLLPLGLLWFRWRVLDLPRRRWTRLPPTVLAIGAFVGFSLMRWVADTVEGGLGLSRGAGAWSPLIVIGILLCVDSWRRTSKNALA